jgi:hypothetical protein
MHFFASSTRAAVGYRILFGVRKNSQMAPEQSLPQPSS